MNKTNNLLVGDRVRIIEGMEGKNYNHHHNKRNTFPYYVSKENKGFREFTIEDIRDNVYNCSFVAAYGKLDNGNEVSFKIEAIERCEPVEEKPNPVHTNSLGEELDKLPRYINDDPCDCCGENMFCDKEGEWVRYEDVEELIKKYTDENRN